MAGTGRGLILDRDGVVNEDSGYLHRIEECRFVDGIFELTAAFAAHGFAIVIASNQSGIGRGLYTEADFERLMDWMKGEFARRGVAIAGVYHCPDHPTEGVGQYRRANPWRKPEPGMLLQAARDLGLDLGRSWTVGDKMSDIEAGRAAGVGVLVRYDPLAPGVARCQDFWVVPRLRAVTELLARESG
ncbi:MAG TPA: HAD family hydrolase [Stellaceae bacterium]|nr:HAD family hydrolase [Stellaceae bacterium]